MNAYIRGFCDGLKPDPRLNVTDWAEEHRILTTDSSAEAGKYRVSRTPYLREIMNEMSPMSATEKVVVIKATQLGFSVAGDNMALCYLDIYPCPILYLLPTEGLAINTSKRRLTPAIMATGRLRAKIIGGKTKDSGGELLTKTVPGGFLKLGYSNSTSSFRSASYKVVILDDCDGMGTTNIGEGDIVQLATARTDAFGASRKIYINSTPTTEGKSLIEKEFAESDQRDYFMPCPHCKEKIKFEWDNFYFTSKKSGDDRRRLTSDVRYQCPECSELIEEYHKTKMMAQGVWVAQNPEHETKGYRLPSYYSPVGFLSWRSIAMEFLNAKRMLNKGNPELMQVWVNTRDARTFKEQLSGVEITDPDSRKEDYETEVPDGVYLITAGVDTQDDRFEVAIIGHGKKGELWFIDFIIIPGDPANEETQDALDALLFDRQFETTQGATMKIFATGIDTGGHRTQAIYEYAQNRLTRKVFALKGSNMLNAPVVNKTFNMAMRIAFKPYLVGTIALKDDFYGRLSVLSPPDRFVHFANINAFDMEFFKQLTAEKRDDTGRYIAIRKRNEAIDCTVYAMVCIPILGADIEKMRRPALHIGEVKNKILRKPKRVENKNFADEF